MDAINGELQLELGGVNYTFKANIGFIRAVEASTGMNMFKVKDVLSDVDNGFPNVNLDIISNIFYQGFKTGGEDINRKQLDNIIDKEDFMQLTIICMTLWNFALSSGEMRGKLAKSMESALRDLVRTSLGETSTN